MTALVQAISRFTTTTNFDTEPLKLVAIFCGAGLVFTVYMILGFHLDLTPASF